MKTITANRAARDARSSSRPYVRAEEKADYDYAQIGFRVYGTHARMIQGGAKKAGCSVADYLRNIVLPMVALDVGVECPEYESLSGVVDVVAQAAQRAGLSVREYERRIAREHAAREIRTLPHQHDPRRETYIAELGSGTRKAVGR